MDITYEFKCKSCGVRFPVDDARKVTVKGKYEHDDAIISNYEEDIITCPTCGSEKLIEGYNCNKCCEFTEELADEHNGFCEYCVSGD